MFFSNSVEEIRSMYYQSWAKFQSKSPLTELEQQIVQVIADHPEYHVHFNTKPVYMDTAYFPELGESNPFLHLGLHLAIRDQLHTNRPAGICKVHSQLLHQLKDEHQVEHCMIDCLAKCLWEAQKQQKIPDEQNYLRSLQELSFQSS